MKDKLVIAIVILGMITACNKDDADSIDTNSETDATIEETGNYYAQGGGVIDSDGNSYNTVIIGNQEWMAENLRTENFPIITDQSQFGNSTSGAMCYYDNDPTTATNGYGALYNAYAARGNICPTGWHIPNSTEVVELISYIDSTSRVNSNPGSPDRVTSDSSAYLYRKEGKWINEVITSTNETGFSALPTGSRTLYQTSNSGYTYDRESFAAWWTQTGGNTSTIGFYMFTYNNSSGEVGSTYWSNFYAFSCRCVKD
ncbi:MAG: hypothetical protein ACJASR_001138 [Psychroserpens sp.]|jgi:uncharacterized protein (TIGR02145 family)